MKLRHNFLAEKLQCGHDLAVRNKAAAIEFREDAVYAERDLCIQAMIEEVRFAEDSPLEGAGFEPSVPRSRKGDSVLAKAKRGRITETTRGGPK